MKPLDAAKQELAAASEKVIQLKRQEVEMAMNELREMERIHSAYYGSSVSQHQPALVSTEYRGLGIVAAAYRYLTEAGQPLTTRELADGMAQRGWTTNGRSLPTANIGATLKNKPSMFTKIGSEKNGKWALTEWNRSGAKERVDEENELRV